MFESARVLVTGAAGFIGSHLVEALVSRGARVTCMARYNSNGSIGNLQLLSRDLLSQVSIAYGDISDVDFVNRTVDGHQIVIHLAALIGIPYSYLAPRSYLRVNIEGTLNVLEAGRQLGVRRVVHVSTSEVYGTAQYTPIDEAHPLCGQSPYSASKIAADKLAESYFRSFTSPVVTVRPFNTYGPRQSARAFIPAIISQAAAQDTILLGALTPVRDLTYVADTVEGLLLAAIVPGIEGETINLGTGEARPIGEFATLVLQIMNKTVSITHDQARERPANSEVMNLVSDNRKARRLLGWEPLVSVDEGLRRTIEFVTAHPDYYRPSAYMV